MSDPYTTQLTPAQEAAFQVWVRERSRILKRDVSKDDADYDIRGFWLSGSGTDARGHGTDRFKKPNHPTFSTESQYATKGVAAGKWGFNRVTGKTTFTAPKAWGEKRLEALREYMRKREPDVELRVE